MTPKRELISWGYLEQQRELHARPDGYGGKGKKWTPTVIALLARFQASSVLDYGCGQGSLARTLRPIAPPGVRVAEYDPAINGKDGQPSFADLVICTDVLEHVEPIRLAAVLEHIRMLARKAAFLVVALDESNKILPDGQNAHLILRPATWWESQVTEAGFSFEPLADLPMPVAYDVEDKRAKRWIAVAIP